VSDTIARPARNIRLCVGDVLYPEEKRKGRIGHEYKPDVNCRDGEKTASVVSGKRRAYTHNRLLVQWTGHDEMSNIEQLVGQTLGSCELRELLGVGGMGTVYRAYQTSLSREVAVKVMSPDLVKDATFLERFGYSS
jgi:hypothetical protein